MSEKYINYYVELLSSTVNDVVLRNISLQANARISEDVIAEQKQQIQSLLSKSENDTNSIDNSRNEYSKNLADQQSIINDLNNKITVLNGNAKEVEDSKHQLAHVDTFRNELGKARKENDDLHDHYDRLVTELNYEIQYLQLTPAQRKKIDNNKVAEIVPETVKDDGMF